MCGPGMPVGCKRAGKRLSVWRLWRVWRVLKVWTVLGRPNGRLGRPEEAIDVWPWDAYWLQAGWQTAKRLEALEGFDVWPCGACWLQEWP